MGSRAKYAFQTLQKENFWLPPALAALFLIIVAILGPEHRYDIGRAFLGYVLPLLPGGLSAYAFLADPALELQFATRRSAARMLFERLSVIFGVVVAVGVLFQLGLHALGVSLAPLGGLWQRQLAWLVPCLTTLALGAAAALLGRNTNAGSAVVGGLWIFQLLARGWFASNPVLRNVLLFYAVMDPFGTPRRLNQVVLSALSVGLLVLTQALLKKQERYL